jgi:UDP-N-acetylglucosamine 4,6-dehydratase
MNFFDGKEVLITGDTGTLGKTLVRLLSTQHKPKGIRVFSRDELKQTQMKSKLQADTPVAFLIGDVRNYKRLCRAMKGVDVVIHTAAMKHVPICEENPFETVETNIYGTENVVNAAIANEVSHVLNISSDKAVHPINLYGATKLAGEKLCKVAAQYTKGGKATNFITCRYGNVLGSRGSVLQLWEKQFKETGIIKLTSANMTRFWVTVEQVAKFILHVISIGHNGETYIPIMPSMDIVTMAGWLYPKAGLDFIGIRPGEKIHETLITAEEFEDCWVDDEIGIVHGPQGSSFVLNTKRFHLPRSLCVEPLTSENNKLKLTHGELIKIKNKGLPQ